MPARAPRSHIDVHVFPAFRRQVRVAWLRKVVRAALAIAGSAEAGSIGIVVADDGTMRDLNKRFRGSDYVTDVLSFGPTGEVLEPDAPPPDLGPEFPEIPDAEAMLGEVVLSYPLALRQADEHNVTVEREVALLVVHGILHLLGHDHAELDEEAAMKALEARALDLVFSSSQGVANT